jgi:hypothetical protein
MERMDELYEDRNVRRRIIEYLGGRTLEDATAVFLMGSDFSRPDELNYRPVNMIDHFLATRRDISRSLWDRKSLIAHLDIEYVNFDFPAEPYLSMERSFTLQEPVAHAVERLLLEHGISPLHLLSGRGHHFVWKVPHGGRVFGSLAKLGRVSEPLREVNRAPHEPVNEPVPDELGLAFSGLAFVMEYLAFLIRERAAPLTRVPIELTDVLVGPGERGRETISIDTSEYGDPLHTRMIRIPFTVYRKPWEKGIADDPSVASNIPLLFMIPFHEMDLQTALRVMRDPERIRELAGRASTSIPDQEEGTERLVEAYRQSEVKRYHDWFYSQEHQPPERWSETYDLMPREALPPCAQTMLEFPNETLLKPAGIQLFVRVMLALGWHPRHIAGLIRSRYERDFGWGPLWYRYDAATRADFYTRVFTGLFVTGRDDLVSFNCRSVNEMGLCLHIGHHCNLEPYRISLLERRNHERIACGPFNRLFLP